MKTNKITPLIAVFSLLLGLLAMSPLHGAEESASVTGRVVDRLTGQSLSNARITVTGTQISTFTDEAGLYRLTGVPLGKATIEIFFTGLDPQVVPVEVVVGGVVLDVSLTSASRNENDGGTVNLNPFVVSTARDTNAESIAVNEQRFSPNLKTVVSTDAFGDVTDGNVGEFLKFLPGVTTDSDSNEGGTVTTISLRGLPSNLTNVSSDGSQLANTGSAMGNGRTFYFGQVSTNNIARVEVTKSPTPSMPADTLAGGVNLVSKSAFEREKAVLNYSVSFAGSSQNLKIGKEALVNDKMIYKIKPGITFDYTLPVNKNLGFVVTGQNIDRYVDQDLNTMTFSTAATAGASLTSPFLQQHRFLEGPRVSTRRSLGLKADWRVTENSVLSATFQASTFLNTRPPVVMVVNAGTNAAPSVAGGRPLEYGSDYTYGATGRGDVTMGGGADFQQPGRTRSANLRYRFDDGVWRVEIVADYSIANGSFRDTTAKPGRFRTVNATLLMPVRIEFQGIDEVGPQSIRVFDNNNNEVSLFDIANYRLNTATSTNRDFVDEFRSGKIDLKRRINTFSMPLAVQVGAALKEQERDIRRFSSTWNYQGPADLGYLTHSKYQTRNDPRFKDVPWLSTTKAWSAFVENPSLFTQTPAQVLGQERFQIRNSEYVTEEVGALYGQVETLLFGKLNVLGGVRYEKTTVGGLGPLVDPTAVWQRNADGSFVRDAQGARVRRVDAGAVGSIEELFLVERERGFKAKRSYDGFYPSVHLTYNLSENLLARASYAETYGRPDFTEIIPNVVITELGDGDDGDAQSGRISIRNPGLEPWTAENIDLSLEYYTKTGGVLSAGVFRKNIEGFFVNESRIAQQPDLDELGLDSQYLGWEIITAVNSGAARIDGFEMNLQQSLGFIGSSWSPYRLFVNGTRLSLSGDQRSNFGGFAPKSMNWGVSYNKERLKIMARWNYRGERLQSVVAALGPGGAVYSASKTTLDVNVDYRLTGRLTLFGNFNNLLKESDRILRYGEETPQYARLTEDRNNGVLITVGIKGTY